MYIIQHLFKKDNSISEFVLNSLMMVLLVNFTGIPVLAWFDTQKFVQYLHKWEQFQVGSLSEYLKFSVYSK